VAGIPHRSLGRKVREKLLHGLEGWRSADDIPADALDEFRDGDDPETSLWLDGAETEHRRDVLLSLIPSRRSIGPIDLALLWQDDAYVGDDLGRRIIQSDGITPYVPGRRLHYHVSEPTGDDSSRLVLAAANRNDIPTYTREAIENLIEDAYLRNDILPEGLDAKLLKEIQKLAKTRFVSAKDLLNEGCKDVFDLRKAEEITQKIVAAEIVAENEIETVINNRRLGKENVFTVYCADGTASRRAARTLREAGKKRVRFLIGGFAEWTRQGFATEAC
jgi:rhodanese-related sulfurtransferase